MNKTACWLFVVALLFIATHVRGEEENLPPPNKNALMQLDLESGKLVLLYGGKPILEALIQVRSPERLGNPSIMGVDLGIPELQTIKDSRESLEQRILFKPTQFKKGWDLVLKGNCFASNEAFLAETRTKAQEKLPLIRNAVGSSRNLRNNAVYDRRHDWVLYGSKGRTTLALEGQNEGGRSFSFQMEGTFFELTFKPRFYQKHKNLPFFEPWKYPPWTGSVCGWCSWWPYRREISQKVVEEVADLFADKLRDFGYEYIQIDDGFQAGYGGTPDDWLNTNERFPGGLRKLVEIIRSRGLKPALWVNVHFGDESFVRDHGGWFMRNESGEHHKGPWLDFGLDGSSGDAVDGVVRPVYRSLREMGWDYVKIDTLRHLLYDGIYPCRSYYEKKGVAGEEAFRNILLAAREELGRDTYILACWGVLPEAIGIADGCRLGTDGFGPTTLVQYNSWNNVVWRNDPDHVDITPEGEEIIRPAVVCMAGAMMLLTDKVEVYRSEAKIEGAMRAAPIPFTLPGQLYDFDPKKTDNVKEGLRNEEGGGPPGPIDADQWGAFCPWWLMEIDRPFEYWNVLARMSWEALPAATVSFLDLGLPADREYLVYEFWTDTFLGACRDAFPAAAQKARDIRVFSIREKTDRPQILSTNRHILQGWPDLAHVEWEVGGNQLFGESFVVKKDPYTMTLRVPKGFEWLKGEVGNKAFKVDQEGEILKATFTPDATGRVPWRLWFKKTGDGS